MRFTKNQKEKKDIHSRYPATQKDISKIWKSHILTWIKKFNNIIKKYKK